MALARNEAPERGSTGKVMVHVSGRREEFPIHDRAAVTFRLPNGAPITCQLRDDVLDVNAGWGPLSIEPRASNNAYMRATAR